LLGLEKICRRIAGTGGPQKWRGRGGKERGRKEGGEALFPSSRSISEQRKKAFRRCFSEKIKEKKESCPNMGRKNGEGGEKKKRRGLSYPSYILGGPERKTSSPTLPDRGGGRKKKGEGRRPIQ